MSSALLETGSSESVTAEPAVAPAPSAPPYPPASPADPVARRVAAVWWAARCADRDAAASIAGALDFDLDAPDPGVTSEEATLDAAPDAAPSRSAGAVPRDWPRFLPAESPPGAGSSAPAEASRSVWPPPPGRMETRSVGSSRRPAPEELRVFGEAASHEAPTPSTRMVDLRTSRGGSLGRIPVDRDPAEPAEPAGMAAAGRDEPVGSAAERVSWLPDDDDLAEQLHRVLRRQARRRGIELT